jgi:hypothetical protein
VYCSVTSGRPSWRYSAASCVIASSSFGFAFSLAVRRGIATSGGSGLAVGNADGTGDGVGVPLLPPPKRPACAAGVVVRTPAANARANNTRIGSFFKKFIL